MLTTLSDQMDKKFELNQTKVKGGCQSYTKAAYQDSKNDLPLEYFLWKFRQIFKKMIHRCMYYFFTGQSEPNLAGCSEIRALERKKRKIVFKAYLFVVLPN